MDTEQLLTFVTLEQERNFTRTASRLFVAQSTITNRINELEKTIGKMLVKRSKKDIQLTEEGKIFLDYAKKMLELEEQVMEQLTNRGETLPLIRIGATNSLYELFVEAATINNLQNKNMRFHIRIDRSRELLALLQQEHLDIVYSYLPFHHKDYACRLLAEDTLVLVTHFQNKSYEQGITLEQLATVDYLHCDFPIQEIENTLRILFPKYHPFLLEIDSMSKVMNYLIRGIGYTFLPKSFVAPFLEAKELRSVSIIDFQLPTISYFQVYKKKKEEMLAALTESR